MAQKIHILSPELIIHPGDTLEEILEDKEMTQKELARRADVTEKHVSQVINGKKNISNTFAKKLEYSLGVSASFWMNLQANYDQELIEYREVNEILQEEIDIVKKLKEVISYIKKNGLIKKDTSIPELVILMRGFLGVSNLTNIPSVESYTAYRVQNSIRIDEYVLFAWEKLCEVATEKIILEKSLDLDTLKKKIPEIKKLMSKEPDPNIVVHNLEKLFSECGISFKVMKNFTGAPVQGFIKKTSEGRLLLCMTIRQHFADIFWFTLFHEIGHIINGDIKNKFIDFTNYDSIEEEKANNFARNTLIPDAIFNEFCNEGIFTENRIIEFSQECEVPPFIVVGRLQKEKFLDWRDYYHLKARYIWSDK